MLALADNQGNIVAHLVVKPVNVQDIILFDASFTNLLETADLLDWDLTGSRMVLDPGFNSLTNRNEILKAEMIPVIKPNIRGLKDKDKINQMLDEFEPLKDIYHGRYRMERCFAWEDVYRRLVIRYERLQCISMGFHYLAYSMINFRWFFGKNVRKL